MATSTALGKFETTHVGLTMRWEITRNRGINRANPFTLYGYVDGLCRMQMAMRTASLERGRKAVMYRLEQIVREDATEEGKARLARIKE
jgi:hypothetical protein